MRIHLDAAPANVEYLFTAFLHVLPTPGAISLRHFPTDFPARRHRPTLRHLYTRVYRLPRSTFVHTALKAPRASVFPCLILLGRGITRAAVCRDHIDHDCRGLCTARVIAHCRYVHAEYRRDRNTLRANYW